ncbi:MAG: thioredoxin family protein [Variovorax sp.]
MAMKTEYTEKAPTREAVDAMSGAVVLDFGTNWCGHCNAARPFVDQVLGPHDGVVHVKVEDGSGRPLGRSFHVKLWPTLVFLHDGSEVARVVRPTAAAPIEAALAQIVPRG